MFCTGAADRPFYKARAKVVTSLARSPSQGMSLITKSLRILRNICPFVRPMLPPVAFRSSSMTSPTDPDYRRTELRPPGVASSFSRCFS